MDKSQSHQKGEVVLRERSSLQMFVMKQTFMVTLKRKMNVEIPYGKKSPQIS